MGKSSWLKAAFPRAEWVDLLDETTYQSLLADVGLFAMRLNRLKAGDTVVVDEIQRLPHLLNEVHRYIEDRGLRFAMSGSSARKLRKAGTNLLAGRAIRKELFPLTPEELKGDFDMEKALRHGTLPLLWNAEGERDVMSSYVQTYLREEIQAEALVRNLPGFARFLPVAALFHASVINASALARDAGVSRTTVLGYLEILEDTLLAFRLPPFEGKLRVKEKKHPKLYWSDPGVVRAVKKIHGAVHPEELGHLFEGWVVATLRAYQGYRDLFDSWNYWAPTENDRAEVDLILWRGKQCIAIEIKASRKFRPEFVKGLKALNDSWKGKKPLKNLVIYLGEESLRTADGFDAIPLKVFLEQLENGKLFP